MEYTKDMTNTTFPSTPIWDPKKGLLEGTQKRNKHTFKEVFYE